MASKLQLAQRLKQSLSNYTFSSAASDQQVLIDELTGKLGAYLSQSAVGDIYEAYIFGAEAHKGQKRLSGEDYIYHPLAVASLLAGMRMDSRTIIAAILHDVLEDTRFTLDQLAERFGDEVAMLVDGVSKVSQLEQESKEHAEAASFRKMFMAMAKDIRVIIIKLSDRLHNMRTLSSLKEEKKRRISKQTLEIYAPIANRLGMRELAQTLEDLSLQNLYPKRYAAIEKKIKSAKRGRKPVIEDICNHVKHHLDQAGLVADVYGREKNVYSIYHKMRKKKLLLKDLQDINAIRIITPVRHQCYQVLGIVHQIYKPRPASFKDYIALPKVNGYQSLHTVVFGPFGQPVEVQIRSRSMHQTAEKGVASHWLYKTETTGEHAPHQLAQQWLSDFLESQQRSANSGEFLDHLKADLFPDKVFVFTPKGDIKRLPRGATALDFAYSVHSAIGDHCYGAKINQITVPLHEKLRNGDHIEIVTARKARPAPSWLNYAITSRARSSIRHYLNQQKTKESVRLGRKLLRTALYNQGYRKLRIPSVDKVGLLKQLDLDDWKQLLIEIGFGQRSPTLVAKQLLEAAISTGRNKVMDKAEQKPVALTIEGTERLLITYATCCYPIPGDHIIGITARGKGLIVHQSRCGNCKSLLRHPDNYVHLEWADSTQGKFQARLRLDTLNEPGVLATISSIIAQHDSNIGNLSADPKHDQTSDISFVMDVKDRTHLANIMRQLHAQKAVIKLYRG